MYIRRVIEDRLSFMSAHYPAVIITGARQTGKTTLVKQVTKNNPEISYVTLDHPQIRDLARSDPEMFLQKYHTPLIIDEIQYAPELLPYINIRIDEDRKPGQYFLTGSQMFRLMRDISETLAGRVGLLSLYGMTNSEIEGKDEIPFVPGGKLIIKSNETLPTVFKKIFRGGMPQMIIDPLLDPDSYFGEYTQTYIERDVRDLLLIRNENKFLKFISCIAARTAQELNLNDIGKDVGIDSKTAENWLSLLVTSGIVFLLQPYSGNTIKRIVKRPKIYFMDTGLACYLSLWNNPEALSTSAMAGAMFETYVVSNIIKEYTNKGIDVRSRLAYYRDNNGKEIDLLILENGVLHPIEIKKSAEPEKSAIKNFSVLENFTDKIGAGAVICLSAELYPLNDRITVIPVGMV